MFGVRVDDSESTIHLFAVPARHTGYMRFRRWSKAPWPADARADERFSGMNGAVAEMRLADAPAGYVMMTVQQWATPEGHFWRRRFTDARDLPDMHFAFRDPETDVQRAYEFTTWYAHDVAEASALYEECVIDQRLEWESQTYDLRWLDAATSARLRSDLFWEPSPY